jgi:autonomous glycyl radical cofactor GrcA
VEQFLPSAAQLLKEDRARFSRNIDWRLPCDTRAARILARDSDLVDLAIVKRIRGEEGEYVIVDYAPLKVLKGRNIQLNNIYHRRELADAVTTNNGGPERTLRIGAERIVFLGTLFDKPDATSQCAVMPDTPEILTAALEGVAADRSAVIGQE